MAALVRRMGALIIQPRGLFLRHAATQSAEASTVEKAKEPKKIVKQDYTNVEGLKQFFDEENFEKDEVRSGRHWTLDELRIKSNSDLHKLWYVLLKENNMLLTLEAAAKEEFELMPNPERIDRVQISMENLELVVRERNKAYFDLEVGETGEQPVHVIENWMGRVTRRSASQHVMPQRYNKSFKEKYPLPFNNRDQRWFLMHLKEQQDKLERKKMHLARRRVAKFIERNPDIDLELLKERFPKVDVDAVAKKVRETS